MNFLKKLVGIYKINLLISITLGIVIIALRIEENPINIISIILGTIAGAFVLELDYFINAYITDPHSSFSRGLKDLVHQKNYTGLLLHLKTNKFIQIEKVLHGAFFQVIVGLIAIFLATSSQNPFGFSLVISVFVQTFYKMYEEYEKHHTLSNWFWILKNKPSKLEQGIYTFAMGLLLVYILLQVS